MLETVVDHYFRSGSRSGSELSLCWNSGGGYRHTLTVDSSMVRVQFPNLSELGVL
jgi:hypothetical protein